MARKKKKAKSVEDPAAKAARLRERRITQMELDDATEETAQDLTTDIRGVYGEQPGTSKPKRKTGAVSMFNMLK